MTWIDSKEKIGLGYLKQGYTQKHYPKVYDQILQLESHSDEESNDWEWDNLSNESCQDKGNDVIHTYTPSKGKESIVELSQNQASSSRQVVLDNVPIQKIEINQWVGESYVPSWRPAMEESNIRFNPQDFYPIETLVDSSEEDFDPSLSRTSQRGTCDRLK